MGGSAALGRGLIVLGGTRARVAVRAAIAAGVTTAVVGCSGGTSPAPAPQSARFGIAIVWDTTQAGNTEAAEAALASKCGLAAAYRQGPASGAGTTMSSYRLPGPVLTQQLTTCLSASKLVMLVDILGGPAGSGR